MMLASLQAVAQTSGGAYGWLNVPSSVLEYALGGVNISNISDDVNDAERNPGLLGAEVENQLGVNYMRWIGESNFAGVKYGHSAGEKGAWMASVEYFGYGTIKGADINGVLTGDISPKDMKFGVTYAHDINDRWRGGARLDFLYSSYDRYSAMALAATLGVNYFNPESDFSLSAVVTNLGGQVKKFYDRSDRLPVDVRLGVSKRFGSSIIGSITAWNLTKWHLPYYDAGDGTQQTESEVKDSFGSNLFRHLVFGLQFVPSERFYAALGYNYKTRTDMSTYKRSFLSGFSIGAGLNTRAFAFGVALAQPHSGAMTVMLNISTKLYEF